MGRYARPAGRRRLLRLDRPRRKNPRRLRGVSPSLYRGQSVPCSVGHLWGGLENVDKRARTAHQRLRTPTATPRGPFGVPKGCGLETTRQTYDVAFWIMRHLTRKRPEPSKRERFPPLVGRAGTGQRLGSPSDQSTRRMTKSPQPKVRTGLFRCGSTWGDHGGRRRNDLGARGSGTNRRSQVMNSDRPPCDVCGSTAQQWRSAGRSSRCKQEPD